MQVKVNIIFAIPLYFKALVPITIIISIIACGFNIDTIANKICFLAEKALEFIVRSIGG